MGFWKRLFLGKDAYQPQDAQPKEMLKVPSSPLGENASTTAASDHPAEESNKVKVAKLMLDVKKPRYAHMAKYHEIRGQFAEAESNYNMLLAAYDQTLGNEHPDFATVIHEL